MENQDPIYIYIFKSFFTSICYYFLETLIKVEEMWTCDTWLNMGFENSKE